jgi:hypothetical protein
MGSFIFALVLCLLGSVGSVSMLIKSRRNSTSQYGDYTPAVVEAAEALRAEAALTEQRRKAVSAAAAETAAAETAAAAVEIIGERIELELQRQDAANTALSNESTRLAAQKARLASASERIKRARNI